MCPLCLMSLAVTVTATTGVGAAAAAVANRVAKSLVRHPADAAATEAASSTPADGTQEARGAR